jgi:hypothetical protein
MHAALVLLQRQSRGIPTFRAKASRVIDRQPQIIAQFRPRNAFRLILVVERRPGAGEIYLSKCRSGQQCCQKRQSRDCRAHRPGRRRPLADWGFHFLIRHFGSQYISGLKRYAVPKSRGPERPVSRFRVPLTSEQKLQGELNLTRICDCRRYFPERRVGRRATVGGLCEHVGIRQSEVGMVKQIKELSAEL